MDRVALDFGFIQIYWYSIFMFLGMLAACIVIFKEAKRRGIDEDFLVNLAFNTIIFGIIGARVYYVLFNLSYYLEHPIEIFEIWNGGLAIHGGILVGLITLIIYCKKHNQDIMKILDIVVVGIILGQAIGRWGNFLNREAFGGFTESLFAMRYKVDQIKETTPEVIENIKKFKIEGTEQIVEYVQVHPTFFYESMWNLGLFFLMNLYKKNKKFDGELVALYFVGYGIGRFWIEGLRTDQLIIGNTGIAVSQALSLVLAIISGIYIIYNRRKQKDILKINR